MNSALHHRGACSAKQHHRRDAAWLFVLLWFFAFFFTPFVHLLRHDSDHIRLPGGGVVFIDANAGGSHDHADGVLHAHPPEDGGRQLRRSMNSPVHEGRERCRGPGTARGARCIKTQDQFVTALTRTLIHYQGQGHCQGK